MNKFKKQPLVAIITVISVTSVLIFNGCRKTDNSDVISSVKKESKDSTKFFSNHSPNNPAVINVQNFIKGQENKHPFINNLTNRVGFPYWDKSLVFSNVKSKSSQVSLADNSAIVVYVPFVRDSQNYVNAIGIVKMTATDTVYRIVCDWQYKNYGFDSTNTGWDAKDVFTALVLMDKTVFGFTKYLVTDGRIWGETQDDSISVTYLSQEITNGVQQFSGLMLLTYINVDINVCPPPKAFFSSGNNTSNTSGDGCHIETISIPVYIWVDDDEGGGGTPSGGGGGGGTTGGGSGGGSGGTGGSNNPGGGWVPPNCNSGGAAFTSLADPCSGGWVPDNNGGVPNTHPSFSISDFNTDSISNPCLKEILNTIGLAGHQVFLLQLYQEFFGSGNDNFSILYKEDTTLIGNSGNPIAGRTKVDTLPNGAFKWTISLNPKNLQNATKELKAAVIFHELVHAFISIRYPNLNTESSQHQFMFSNWVQSIGRAIKDIYPGLPDSDYVALALGGLEDAYIDPATNQIIPVQDNYAAQHYGTYLAPARNRALQFFNGTAGSPC